MACAFNTAVALRGEQTGGAISVIENTVPARWDGPPLHHHAFDATFYTVDNLTAAEARVLVACTPAGGGRHLDS